MGVGCASAGDLETGRHLYAVACAHCHGSSGRGDGPLAAILTVRPSDLTALSARNGGRYPLLQVIHVIDGRSGVREHDGAMPSFGGLYDAALAERMGRYSAVLETRGRMLAVALYLERLQR
jgi:mono/diheme cytochrome c family protein